MGYHKHGYRQRKHRRANTGSRSYGPAPIERFFDLVVESIVALFSWIGRGFEWSRRPAEHVSPASAPPLTNPYVAPPLRAARPFSKPVCPPSAQTYERPFADMPYRRTSGILTKGERAVWPSLLHAVKGKYHLFCKVRLADVVHCPPARADERQWFRKIARYHVDFGICDLRTTIPLLVVELDDRRHRQRSCRSRDDFKDSVLQAAGMPVYRIRAQQAYNPLELTEDIERILSAKPSGT